MAENIIQNLEPSVLEKMKIIGVEAASYRCRSFLVGGIVRDLILRRKNTDLDIVVEGNAIELAKQLAKILKMDMAAYKEFMTATFTNSRGERIDLATARREFYPKPGALPVVDRGNLQADMFRRDFTINSMALSLHPDTFGELVDIYGGYRDLDKKLIRVFHANSFLDDPTRILRAVRFEQRFGFKPDSLTKELLHTAIKAKAFQTVTAPRYFAEFKKIFQEEDPLKPLKRLHDLNILRIAGQKLSLNTRAIKGLKAEIKKVAKKAFYKDFDHTWFLFFLNLLESLSANKMTSILERIQIKKDMVKSALQARKYRQIHKMLGRKLLKNNEVYSLLKEYTLEAVIYFRVMASSALVKKRLELYLEKLRHIVLKVNGDDIKTLGVSSGKKVGQILDSVLEIKLNRNLKTKSQELKVAKEIIAGT